MKKRIYYHDTDCGGVVYYANYLKYFEEARTELLRAKRIDLFSLSEKGTFFVVASVDIKYKSPARYADELEVTSNIERVKTASIDFFQQIKRDHILLVECRTKLVCVSSEFSPQAIPESISSLLQT